VKHVHRNASLFGLRGYSNRWATVPRSCSKSSRSLIIKAP